MYALVDCNNFYVSCERVFNPGLNGKPVIVLSNNDGCAISRSDEAKALGVEQSSLGRQIGTLERVVGIQLFSRAVPAGTTLEDDAVTQRLSPSVVEL